MGDNSRLHRLSEEALGSTLTNLESWLDELKSSAPQYINGSDVLNFITDTGITYDFNGLLSQDAGASTGNSKGLWEITATAQHASAMYSNLLIFMWVGSTAALYEADSGFYDLANPTVHNYKRFVPNVMDMPNDNPTLTNQKTWAFTITGDTQRNVWWKAYVPGLDTASITITRTL